MSSRESTTRVSSRVPPRVSSREVKGDFPYRVMHTKEYATTTVS